MACYFLKFRLFSQVTGPGDSDCRSRALKSRALMAENESLECTFIQFKGKRVIDVGDDKRDSIVCARDSRIPLAALPDGAGTRGQHVPCCAPARLVAGRV